MVLLLNIDWRFLFHLAFAMVSKYISEITDFKQQTFRHNIKKYFWCASFKIWSLKKFKKVALNEMKRSDLIDNWLITLFRPPLSI